MSVRLLPFLLLICGYSFGQEVICSSCDTTYYFRKKLFGELERLYPIRLVCYFENEKGKTKQKCLETEWKAGKQNGVEKAFRYEDSIYLLNFWGKPFKPHAADWRKKTFGARVIKHPLLYKGYWKHGEKHGLWVYYSTRQKVACYEKYKKGTLKKTKIY